MEMFTPGVLARKYIYNIINKLIINFFLSRGQLGMGDLNELTIPSLVEALSGIRVKF